MTISAPDPDRLTLGTGAWDSCGIIDDGSVRCWGINPYEIVSGSGGFFQISLGRFQGCGLRRNFDDNTGSNVNCWSNDRFGETPPPPGIYSQISVGAIYSCAIKAVDHSVVCWGLNTGRHGIWYGQAIPPPGRFRQIGAGFWHTCAISLDDNTVTCWGRNTGFRDDQEVYYGQADPPSGQFLQISSGPWHSCGIRMNRSVVCWGNDNNGQATPPVGSFTQIDAGSYHTCGIRIDGSAVCWGQNFFGQSTAPTGTAFTQISAGYYHTCGVTSSLDGNGSNVVCWGISDSEWWGFGQTTPPEGIHLIPAVDESYTPDIKPLSGAPVPEFFFYPYDGDTQIFGGQDIGVLFNASNSYDTEPDGCCIRNYLWWVFDPQKPHQPYFAQGAMHQVSPDFLTHAGDYFVGLIVIDEEGNPSTPIGTTLTLE
jgi:hypothetical protein